MGEAEIGRHGATRRPSRSSGTAPLAGCVDANQRTVARGDKSFRLVAADRMTPVLPLLQGAVGWKATAATNHRPLPDRGTDEGRRVQAAADGCRGDLHGACPARHRSGCGQVHVRVTSTAR